MTLPYFALVFLALVTLYSGFVSFREPKDTQAKNWILPKAPSGPARIIVGISSLVILTTLAIWIGLGVRQSSVRSWRFLIPEGYTGWVRIEFEIQNAPALPNEGGRFVIKIPAGGVLRTSSPEQYGPANDQYFYYSAQETRPLPVTGDGALIWGKINGEALGASGKRKFEEFFVGTEQQFKNQLKE
jgi:hypothetical protein